MTRDIDRMVREPSCVLLYLKALNLKPYEYGSKTRREKEKNSQEQEESDA